jgi:hypothetical protein
MLLFGAFACTQSKDRDYFNGNIQYFDDNPKVVKKVSSKIVPLNGLNYGLIAIYDSLLICWNPKLPDYFFNVFHVDTGEEIGSFCRRGQGPEDAVSVNCIFQFFKKENDIMTLLYAPNEAKLFFWNINQSIRSGSSVFDTIVAFNNKGYEYKSYQFLFLQAKDTLLGYVQSNFLSEQEASTPFYEKRTIYTNEVLQKYPVYKTETVRNEATSPRSFFYSWSAMKPDGSKIVQAMYDFPQINILDTYTGDIMGYRMKNSFKNFSFETKLPSTHAYYNSVQADDYYIYAAYWGKEQWRLRDEDAMPDLRTIHVFNWEGELLYELQTDRVFFRIWLDQVRNRLYTQNHDTDEVYYVDLNELNVHKPG